MPDEIFYTRAGTKFELVGFMVEGVLLELVEALYGLPNSGNRWHAHLSNTLREISFKPTIFDPYIWIRENEGGYDYIWAHINDVLVMSIIPTSIFNKFK